MLETPYDVDIKIREEQLAVLKNELGALYQKRAESLCPFKVGQVVVNEQGWRAKIQGIDPLPITPYFRMYGERYLRNGRIGSRFQNLGSEEGWKLEKQA